MLRLKVDFNEHLDNNINKCNKIISLVKKQFLTLSRKRLPTTHKCLVRHDLHHVDIIEIV